MTRHRSPADRDAQQHLRRREPRTVPFVVPADAPRGAARHRSHRRAALRHGAVAAGITGGALALVAPAALQLPAQDAQNTLALSAEGAALPDRADTSGAGATGGAVSTPSESAATADLFKATDRARQASAETAAAVERAQGARDAAARAEQERRASITDCGASGSYGGVADSVQTVGNAMECLFPGHDVLGVGSRGNESDHPGGYALDFMTDDGDPVADCVTENADSLGVSYVIWNQRINTGSGWESMEDRGSAPANHEDHVHISFDKGSSPDVAALRTCG